MKLLPKDIEEQALVPTEVSETLQRCYWQVFLLGVLLNYSCEYPVTTALQGRLALSATPWLAVARATQAEKGNCDSGTP